MSVFVGSVFVGSLNPGKVQPVQEVFTALAADLGLPSPLSVQGVNVPSGVPDQPLGVEETALGATNRAAAALAQPGALWGVGLEGGVRLDEGGRGWLFGVVVVAHASGVNAGRTAELPVPPAILPGVLAGRELGTLMDELLGTQDLKRGVGTVGALTGGLVTRPDVWRQALALTLAPFLHPQLYPVSDLSPRG